MKPITKLWLGIAVLVILSPLGLIIPDIFKAGGAWGEWEPGEIKKIMGYVPGHFEKLSGLWKAPMRDYAFNGWEKGMGHLSFAYICSAVIGIIIIAGVTFALGKLLAKKEKKQIETK